MDAEIQAIVEKHKQPCIVGSISATRLCPIGSSKKGGFPDVGENFEWPRYDGKHLSFLAQIDARLVLGEGAFGTLQFFWNERNCGYSIKDEGAFRVLNTKSPLRRLTVAPETEYKKLGFFKRTHTPTVWKEESLDFRNSFSLPSIDRLEEFGYDWDCDRDDLYCREAEALAGFIRIGGPPFPVQSDRMEKDCERIRKNGPKESWRLLLEVGSESDLMWGDGGRLYWFIHKDDLNKGDFTRVWMQMQSH